MAAFELIEHVEVGAGGVASVTFSSISASYETLRLFGKLRGESGDTTQDCLIRVNGDSGANYPTEKLDSSTGTPVTSLTGSASYVVIPSAGTSATADTFTQFDCWMPGYSSTSFFKPFVMIAGKIISATLNTNRTYMIGAEWLDTSAIDTILLQPTAGDLAQYSTMTLYGINGA